MTPGKMDGHSGKEHLRTRRSDIGDISGNDT